jgi:hypothetical protein
MNQETIWVACFEAKEAAAATACHKLLKTTQISYCLVLFLCSRLL